MQKKLYDDIFYGALTALLFSAFIYLEYFELEELVDIKDELLRKKQTIEASTKDYVEEIYEKLI